MSKKKNISLEEVKHIADLAKLPLEKDDLEKFQKNLTDILDLVGKLEEVDTKDVIPTSQVTGLENVFREDVIKPSLSQQQALSNAPRKHKGYFVTKSIFE